MADERRYLPSASSIERILLCPGSRNMEVAVPDTRTTEADLGDTAHALAARYFTALAALPDWSNISWPSMPTAMYEGLEINLVDVVERFIGMVESAFLQWISRGDFPPRVRIVVEERIFLNDPDTFDPFFSGKADVVFICGRRAFIPDFKSLGGEQTESTINPQLRAYAVLVAEEHGCNEVEVAICQPRVSGKPLIALYDAEALRAARYQILTGLVAAGKPDAPLIAGTKQCKFCKARATCSAAGEYASLAAVAPSRDLAYGEAQRIVAQLTVSERIALWEKTKTVLRILDAVKTNLLALPEAELASHDLEVLTQKGDRVIESKHGPAAYKAVADKVAPDDWNACCKVAVSKLENKLRAATGQTVKETKADLERRLGPLLTHKDDSKVLARISPNKLPKQQQQTTLELPAST